MKKCVGIFFGVCVVCTVQAQQKYIPIELDVVDSAGDSVRFNDLNNDGYLVGHTLGGAGKNVFLYDFRDKQLESFRFPAGYSRGVSAAGLFLNDNGDFAGVATKDGAVYSQAFRYSGYWDMFGEEKSSAIDINNLGHVTGQSFSESAGRTQGFIYDSSGFTNLGDLTDRNNLSSDALSINDHGVVVGNADTGFSWGVNPSKAYKYTREDGMVAITEGHARGRFVNNNGTILVSRGKVGGDRSGFLLFSSGERQEVDDNRNAYLAFSGLNNNDVVVGRSQIDNWGGSGDMFVYKNGQMFDPNNSILSNREWVDFDYPESINDHGQILVDKAIYKIGYQTETTQVILQPLPESPNQFSIGNQQMDARRRLGLWNTESKEFTELPEDFVVDEQKNVHLVTHGWGRGFEDDVTNPDGSFKRVWDGVQNSDGATFGGWLNSQADMLAKQDPDSVVMAYSWIDQSATDNSVFSAKDSQKHTVTSGKLLARVLSEILNDSHAGKLHLLGHSHGSKVTTIATSTLENAGVGVDHLTLFDSPESVGSEVVRGANNLDDLIAQLDNLHGIGVSDTETFVESYFSEFGKQYDGDVVNVELIPGTGDSAKDHSYPIGWYTKASDSTSDVAFNWFSEHPVPGSYYKQDWMSFLGVPDPEKEYILVRQEEAPPEQMYQSTPFSMQSFWTDGVVSEDDEGNILFQENSPAFWYSMLRIEEEDVALKFDYEFLDVGDGDQLGVWIDEELMFLIEGELVGEGEYQEFIDLSGFDPRLHTLTVALHSTGESNAEILVGDFEKVSVPEPTSLVGIGLGLFLATRRRR